MFSFKPSPSIDRVRYPKLRIKKTELIMAKKKTSRKTKETEDSELVRVNKVWRERREKKLADMRITHDANGHFHSGVTNPSYKISKRVAMKVILRRMKFKEPMRSIGRRYSISHTMVSNICKGNHRYSNLDASPTVLANILLEIIEENKS